MTLVRVSLKVLDSNTFDNMCRTTHIEFTCGHEDVHAVPSDFCAIAYAQLYASEPVVPIRVAIPNKRIRLHCWALPQGVVNVSEMCPQCQFRQEKYDTPSTAVSMLQISEAAYNIRARAFVLSRSNSRSTTSSNTANTSSTDSPPRK